LYYYVHSATRIQEAYLYTAELSDLIISLYGGLSTACPSPATPLTNKANTIIVAASSTQVNVGRNAGGTHARRTLGIYTHSTLAVLAVSDNCPPF
jgi:hypothetical protein